VENCAKKVRQRCSFGGLQRGAESEKIPVSVGTPLPHPLETPRLARVPQNCLQRIETKTVNALLAGFAYIASVLTMICTLDFKVKVAGWMSPNGEENLRSDFGSHFYLKLKHFHLTKGRTDLRDFLCGHA
jgi:hypothetical protein